MPRTLVTLHAHPDDEALLTAGTMAKAAAAGHRVVCVFATRGEAGDSSPELRARLATARPEEARAAAEILGVARTVFLDYPDSGEDASNQFGFAHVPVDDAAEKLAAVLREEAADVLTGYDAAGGYRHPDHVQVHRVARRAAEIAGTPGYLEATVDRSLLMLGIETAVSLGHDVPTGITPEVVSTWYSAPNAITTTVDVSAFLDQKRAAMRAHASQALSSDGVVRTLSVLAELPDELFAVGFSNEWYIRRTPALLTSDTDVFAGL
ncbi:MAG: PIG-L deacetylase family protein [Acidimicrobiia bacterium]